MPISAEDLQMLGKSSLEKFLRNKPVSQIGVNTPLLDKLMSGRKLFLGAKENVVGQLRVDYGTNFQWGRGETPIVFNTRDTLEQTHFPWGRCNDGFRIPHDTLFSNGIKVREGKSQGVKYTLEKDESIQLTNLLVEQQDAFITGFKEKLSLELHRNGSANVNAVAGLDALVSLTPATGTVGGIDRTAKVYWRNNVATGLTSATMLDAMEAQWRACHRNGGAPDFILAGSDFIDAYRKSITLTQNTESGKASTIDAGIGTGVNNGVFYKGVPIVWDPQFYDMDQLESPETPWEKRCYFINSKHMKLYDDEMDIVSPDRPHDILSLYQMVNLRLALTIDRANSHAVLAIA